MAPCKCRSVALWCVLNSSPRRRTLGSALNRASFQTGAETLIPDAKSLNSRIAAPHRRALVFRDKRPPIIREYWTPSTGPFDGQLRATGVRKHVLSESQYFDYGLDSAFTGIDGFLALS